MSEYLQHGKFKYIDKWRSKTGKWVYKYKDDVSNDVLSLKNGVKNRLAETRRYLVNKPKKEGSSKASNWHDTGRDVMLSKKKKYEESIKGHDKTRIRKVVDSSGKTSYRREYQDSAQQQNLSRKVKQYNDAIKPNSKVGRFIADFNDKYGPKYVHTISAHSGDGKNYVISYTKNLFGNRSVDVESYSYYDTKRKQRKRRREKRRDAVKMDGITGSLYLMHHGVKGQKWGVRKYQNSDGSLTPEGRKRYGLDGKKLLRSTENVREAGRRSAKESAKTTFKKNLGRSAALSGAGAALGTVAAVSGGAMTVGLLPVVGAVAATAFVSDMATNVSIAAVMGRHYGRKAARQQDKQIQESVKNGESFVLDEITAVTTSNTTWYGSKQRTEIRKS